MSDPITRLGEAVKSSAEAVKPLMETGAKLLESLLGEPCKVSGQLLSDQIYWWQWRNRIRIGARAKQIMETRRIATKVVPSGFLLPLLDASGNVEQAELQELWANLIASAVEDSESAHPAFIETLKRMSIADARLLKRMAEHQSCGLLPGLLPSPDEENGSLLDEENGSLLKSRNIDVSSDPLLCSN
jgi:hypothetical protein